MSGPRPGMMHGRSTVRPLFKVGIAVLLIAACGDARQLAFAQQQPEASPSAAEAHTGADPKPASVGRPPAPFTTELKSHLTVHADVSATELVTKRWKILIPSAIQALSQQHIKFIDGMQTVDVVEAYTEKADGRRVPVPAASILTQDAASGLQATYLRDQKQKTIIYPDVAVGDTLVLSVRLEQGQGTFPGQFTDISLFPRSQSFTAAEVTVDAPVALDLQVRTSGQGLTDEVMVNGDMRHHRIALAPAPYHPEEPKAVSPLDREPMVLISTFKSYEEIGRAYGEAALPKAAVTPQIAALADEITRNIDDRRAQAVAIDAWVKKNIRYVAVYLALGRVVPNEATQVLTNRFGDCKDKVTLMTALLAAKGIASEAALINAGNAYTLPDPPEPQVFNHVIVYLPDLDLYDDPTVAWAAFGVLAPEAYDKPVVRVSATGVRVARTPAMRPEDHVAHATTSITVAADGTVTGETKESNTGMFGIVLRLGGGRVETLGETAASRQLQIYGTPGTGHFDLGNIDDTVDPAVVTGSFKLRDKFNFPAGNARKAIPVGMPLTVRPGNFLFGQRLADRQSAFVCFAGRQIEDIDATFDAALPMPEPLVNENVENPLFTFHSTYAIQGRTLKIHREFVSRVPGEVCSPAVEAQIGGDMNAVRTDLYSGFAFAAPVNAARVATTGQKRTIDFLTMLNADCSSIGFATFHVVEQPQHGVVAAE
ncbi:MAG: DUF3857 domain-containing protein, partial [Frankiaceae bacterium]|nr:DUF3857 domain-containing protein [Frankiaceae bacterium]